MTPKGPIVDVREWATVQGVDVPLAGDADQALHDLLMYGSVFVRTGEAVERSTFKPSPFRGPGLASTLLPLQAKKTVKGKPKP